MGQVCLACLGVFGSLSAQANAATDPIFPLTTQPGLVARPWDLGGVHELIDHAISPDGQRVLVVVRPLADGPIELRVYDDQNRYQGRAPLPEAMAKRHVDMFFLENGQLVLDDSVAFYFVDWDRDKVQVFRQCRQAAYPLRDSHAREARDDAERWREDELKRLQQQFNFTTAQVNAPPEKWPPAYRTAAAPVYRAMGERIEAGIHARYVKTLQPLVAASEPLQGLQRIYSTGVVQQYARLPTDGGIWYCDVHPLPGAASARWLRIVSRQGLEVEADSPRVAREGQSVRDGGTTVSVLRRKSTSTYEQDLVGRATEDVVYEVSTAQGSYRTLVKDAPFKMARDLAMRLASNELLVRYRGGLHLLPRPVAPTSAPK